MATSRIAIKAPPESVFAVLDDPYAYAAWVVGTRRIVDADDGFPGTGRSFHARVGTRLGEVPGTTTVLEREPASRLVLQVRMPAVEAQVEIELSSPGPETLVTLRERPVSPSARRVWNPVFERLVAWRNDVSLRRLKRLTERRLWTGA